MGVNPFKLANAAQMREMDRITIEDYNIPGMELMEAAGKGTVEGMLDILPPQLSSYNEMLESLDTESSVLILCGSGNNGGDGFVVARYLSFAGYNVVILLLCDPEKLSGDAKTNFDDLPESVRVFKDDPKAEDDIVKLFTTSGTIVDAMLGTGLMREVSGRYADIIKLANSVNAFKVALDIPSGISSDTGQILGEAFKANVTYTYGLKKLGHAFYPGKEYSGRIVVLDIGIPDAVVNKVGTSATELYEGLARQNIGALDNQSHKGSLGHTLIIGGCEGKGGAAILTTKAAVRSGVGLVSSAVSESTRNALLTAIPESMSYLCNAENIKDMLETYKAAIKGKNSVIIGPGWGVNDQNAEILRILLEEFTEIPFVLDADALSILAEYKLLELISKRSEAEGVTVLTPHPKEAARLLDIDTAEVQSDRLKTAQNLVNHTGASIILKGASTVVCFQDEAFVCPFGSPAMATGGSGDVLSGLLAGRFAAGNDPKQEIVLSVCLHALSGDLAKEKHGERGTCASDIIDKFSKVWLAWENGEDVF